MKYTIKPFLLVSSILCFMYACEPSKKEDAAETESQEYKQTEEPNVEYNSNSMIAAIEKAHQKESWYQKEIVEFDLELIFGGKQRFKGRIAMTPDGGKVRMSDSSKVMIWDGEAAYISPDSISYKKARFDLLTWSYFFAAAYKLSDPGTKHEDLGKRPLKDQQYDASKMTFGDGVGDSPDDWYIIYKAEDNDLLAAMAYIVTYSQSADQAEEDPHLITYEAYEEVKGIPMATVWNFWTWNEQGETDKLLGTAQLSNFKFIKRAEDLFQPTSYFREAKKPEA